MDWLMLFIGGLCEVGFVVTMKLSDGFKKLKYTILTGVFMVISFYTLSYALKTIPMGVGYAIWAGIGAIGSVAMGILFFNESRTYKKFLFMSMIIIGIIGLKLATN